MVYRTTGDKSVGSYILLTHRYSTDSKTCKGVKWELEKEREEGGLLAFVLDAAEDRVESVAHIGIGGQ